MGLRRTLTRLGLLVLAASATAALAASPAAACGGSSCTFLGASADGSRVVFRTNAQLVPGDTDAQADIYERSGGVTTLISTNTAGTANGAFDADFNGGVSADGTRVFFDTDEQLAASDTDMQQDVYQRFSGTTTQVSTNTAGTANGVNGAFLGGVSADGTRAFFSTNEQLAATDTDASQDIYERSGGTTTQVSTNTAGTANGVFQADFRGASTDGTRIRFVTNEQLATTDMDAQPDIYERSGGMATLISTNTAGTANGAFSAEAGGASADGTRVFFFTDEQLAATDMDAQTDIYERFGGTTTQVSTNTAGTANGAFSTSNVDGTSADGLRVFFGTDEQLAATDMDAQPDIYERFGGTTTQVSTNTAGTANGAFGVESSRASADGTRVFFKTGEQLAASDMDMSEDVYERSGGVTTLISTNTPGTANGAFDADFSRASADGTKVFFETGEQMAASDTDGGETDVYERSGGTTTHVSTNTAGTANAASDAFLDGVSADGTRAIFTTSEQLAASDTDASPDVYERFAGTTTLISASGFPPPPTNPSPTPALPTPPVTNTGQRAAALKKCKKKKSARARRNCRKRANKLPV